MLRCCQNYHEKTTTRVPTAIMLFFACFMSYCVRLNFNFAIIAMVTTGKTASEGGGCVQVNKTSSETEELHDYGPRYDWDHDTQGYLKAAYGIGYTVSHFPAGVLADTLGAKNIVAGAVLIQGLLNALVPVASGVHWGAVFAVRVLCGLGGGVIYPGLHALVAQWSPPQEKGKFVFSLMGGLFAGILISPSCAAISEASGWSMTFYVVTIICCIWTIFWCIIVANSPSEHKWISEKELEYIITSQEGHVKAKKKMPQLKNVMTSVPFLALMVAHFGNLWGLALITTDMPTFLNEVLGFNLKNSGFLNSLPTMGRLIMALIIGNLVDYIRSKQMWSNLTALRKTFVIFSHIVPGVLLASVSLVSCDGTTATVALMVMSLTSNGASTVTNLVNHHDLAPNYAGSLYGFMNGVASTTLIIVPWLTGLIISDENDLDHWRIVFLIGSAAYISTGVVFIFLGSAKIQSWNESEETPGSEPPQA